MIETVVAAVIKPAILKPVMPHLDAGTVDRRAILAHHHGMLRRGFMIRSLPDRRGRYFMLRKLSWSFSRPFI